MAFLIDLWIPIVLSAILVFLVSSLIHMLLQYHKNDYRKLPDEDGIQAAMRGFNIPAGDYFLPYAGSTEAMRSPEYLEKVKKGPVMTLTVFPVGGFGMAAGLVMWFVYSLIVGIFAAYIADRTLAPDTHYLQVFRIVGASAFMGYSLALMQASIWYKKNWCATLRSMFDGLIYALLTAGVFGWLWPR